MTELKVFIFNDIDEEYTVFEHTQGEAEKRILKYLNAEDQNLEELGISFSVYYEIIDGDVLRRSLR